MRPILFIIVFLTFLLQALPGIAQVYLLTSPDGQVQYELQAGEKIQYSVFYRGRNILDHSGFELKFDQAPVFGRDVTVIAVQKENIRETWKPVAGAFEEVQNDCNQMTFRVRENRFPRREIQMTVRAYDDGIAFRYTIPESWKRFIPTYESRNWILLSTEHTEFTFTADHQAWVADYGAYATHQEAEFNPMELGDISSGAIIGLPLLVKMDEERYAAITEANLIDWAGMYLKKRMSVDQNQWTLVSDLSPLPEGGGTVRVVPGSSSPWRVLMLGSSPGALIESEIINNLNEPCALEDPSWIRPGISAWDHWWSGEVQMDTETIKEYVQLASDMGWEYMLIDWHWYGPPFSAGGTSGANQDADITTVNPAVDMPEILDYAGKRNVKLVLWLLWNHVEKQMDEAFALYEKWGIAGVKIDFMARDDQEMVQWYHRVVKKAAEHHLVVDFHGAYKPTGWSRTYPNLLTREGVLGNEYSKWSSRITPEHNVTLPYTRMLAGAMDYTPGAFLNVTPEKFRTGAPAEVMNTRAHQLAMFVVYFSPYTVACDHPDHYRDQPGIEFLKEVPTTWDDTRVLSGEVGEYIVMARKKGKKWFLGAMADSESRSIPVKLDFLPAGKHELHFFRDASDSDRNPQNLEMGTLKVEAGQEIRLEMVPGGGFAGWIE